MCDCYGHPCAEKGCTKTLPWHIGDYKFPREKFFARCPKHNRLAPQDSATFFAVTIDEYKHKIEVWAVNGPEVGDAGDNHPNEDYLIWRNGKWRDPK